MIVQFIKWKINITDQFEEKEVKGKHESLLKKSNHICGSTLWSAVKLKRTLIANTTLDTHASIESMSILIRIWININKWVLFLFLGASFNVKLLIITFCEHDMLKMSFVHKYYIFNHPLFRSFLCKNTSCTRSGPHKLVSFRRLAVEPINKNQISIILRRKKWKIT